VILFSTPYQRLRKRFSLDLVVRQYLSSPLANITVLPQTFSKHNEATTNKFSRLLFILEQVKTVPNGRFLLLSSACRSKGKKEKNRTTIWLKGKTGRKV